MFNDSQRELVDLLRNELASWIDELAGRSQADVTECLSVHRSCLERMSSAADMVGLAGVVRATQYLLDRLQALSQQDLIEDDVLCLLESWPVFFLGYFQYMEDAESLVDCATDLVDFLADEEWPVCDAVLDRDSVLELLCCGPEIELESEACPLPNVVDSSLLSIDVDASLNPALLDSLLQELPGQVQVFSDAIESLLQPDSSNQDYILAQLATAQRIAHTIKGSGNVVGLPGIANLMHYCEDFLELLVKHKEPVADQRSIYLLLQDVADAQASLLDALLLGQSTPAGVETVMQALLDGIHGFHHASVESARSDAPVASVESVESSVQAETEVETNVEPEAETKVESEAPTESFATAAPPARQQLRIDRRQADHLLQLQDELSISGIVQMAQFKDVISQLGVADELHKQIRLMSDELQYLIETQGGKLGETLEAAGAAPISEFSGSTLDSLEMERYNELHSFSNRLQEVVADSRQTLQSMKSLLSSMQDRQTLAQQGCRQSQELLLETRMMTFDTLASRLQRCVRQACRGIDRQVQFTIEGGAEIIEQDVLGDIVDPIMHLLRNSVDHGIESPEQRVACGKGAAGNVSLHIHREGNTLCLVLKDDGRGIDIECIKQKAAELGLLENLTNLEQLQPQCLSGSNDSQYNNWSDDQWYQLLLLPGFSTRDQATQLSGRGIGLDVVNTQLRKINGHFSIASQVGLGTQMTLKIPVNLHTAQVVLTQLGGQSMALLADSIDQILYLSSEEAQRLVNEDGQWSAFFEYAEQSLPLLMAEQLLGMDDCLANESLVESKKGRVMVLLKSETLQLATAVILPQIQDCEELVIKPLNAFCPKPVGVVGCSVLGDGAVAPVLELSTLVSKYQASTEPAVARWTENLASAASTRSDLPMALVVDDSLSVRRSLEQLVADIGLEVRTAKDGFEAIGVIDEKQPAVMLVDMEMPRMNGLELTAHLRAQAATSEIPVIMITSRSGNKHRRLAEAAGVTQFMTKPFSEDELSEQIRLLAKAG